MAKRKSKRTAKHKTKRYCKGPAHCNASPRATGLYSLPDHLIAEILHWIRPKDEDQPSIWPWVRKMSVTCAAFRRVIKSVKSAPLTPTVFELIQKGPFDDGLWVEHNTVDLVNAIKRFEWMGANVKTITVEVFNLMNPNRHVTSDALRSLLTTPGRLPKLTDVNLNCSPICVPILVDDKSFLPKLAQVHPGLTTLNLQAAVLGLDRQDYLSPRAFAELAASLPNLQRFGIHEVPWLESNHLVAFFSNLKSKLTELTLLGYNGRAITGEVVESISTHCHYLVSLAIIDGTIPSHQFTSILRSNKNLSRVDVAYTRCDNARHFFDAIVEHEPRLDFFGGCGCDWVDDDGIMRLVNGQINAFGHVLLTKLVIEETQVTPCGLRSVLTRWREVNQGLPLEVHANFRDEESSDEESAGDESADEESSDEESADGESSDEESVDSAVEEAISLANDFPEVNWRFS